MATDGVAAHSSTPELGHNAIQEMVSLLNDFTPNFEVYTKSKTHSLTGNATWAPTLIQGGTGLNTIPEICRVSVDRRLVPGEIPDKVLSFVDSWLAEKQRQGRPWRLGKILLKDDPFEANLNWEVVTALRHVLKELGLDSAVKGAAYGTDATKIVSGGTPCIVFGPGRAEQAHKKDEWIFLPDVDKAEKITIQTIMQLDRMLQQKE
jgi:acetylornithine deacetylase